MLFEGIYETLTNLGISAENIGLGVALFFGIGALWSTTLFILCYFFSPIKTIFSKIPIKFVQDRIKSYSESGFNQRYLAWIPVRFRARIIVSMCEMFILRGLLSPIIIPMRIWIIISLLS